MCQNRSTFEIEMAPLKKRAGLAVSLPHQFLPTGTGNEGLLHKTFGLREKTVPA
jgi:hypothetical protein